MEGDCIHKGKEQSHEPGSQRAGNRGAIFTGILLIIGGVLWLPQGFAGIVHGSSYIAGANTLVTTSARTSAGSI